MTAFDHPTQAQTRIPAATDFAEAQLWCFLDTVDVLFSKIASIAEAKRAKARRRAEARAAADRLLLQ